VTFWAAWFGALAVAGAVVVMAYYRRLSVPPEFRPHRFKVTSQGFGAPFDRDSRAVGVVVLVAVASLAVMQIQSGTAPSILAGAIPWIMFAVLGWGRAAIMLTPSGLLLRSTLIGPPRTVAWGDPLEVPRTLAVSPWFVSAAIEWYVHHPDERSAIGTHAGHRRLLDALGVTGDPARPPKPPKLPKLPKPPIPPEVKHATVFTYAGVVLGVLAAGADLVLVAVLRPADDLAVLQAIAWPFIAAIAGVAAVGLVHAVRRGGDDRARVTVAVVVLLATVMWPPNPIDGPALRAAGVAHRWGVLILDGRIAVHLAMVGLGIGAFLSLTAKAARTHSLPVRR
jgi:hypothetical protein